jgi:hypothetical protein
VCGILGTYDIAVDAGRWAAMSDALAHRGPDAAGTWTGPDDTERVRLGLRRLSIIDLSAAVARHGVRMRRVLLIAVTVPTLAGATGVILDRWVDYVTNTDVPATVVTTEGQ